MKAKDEMEKLNKPGLRTETLKIIGNNLYALRMNVGKSLKEVSKDVKISATIMSQIEKGKYDLWLTQLFRLSEYYKVKPSDLL